MNHMPPLTKTSGFASILTLIIVAIMSLITVSSQPNRVVPMHPKNGTDPVRVFAPSANADVISPVEVRGEARGSWFFEASFPVRILDRNGKELGHAPAQAQGDWMTDGFVPFRAVVSFSTPNEAGPLTLVLEKDNPSGLPENAERVTIPLQFTDNYHWVKIYFLNTIKDPNVLHCDTLYPVDRPVPKTERGVARAALGHLIGGPDEVELSYGYTTAINKDTRIQSLKIEKGVAFVDFNEAFITDYDDKGNPYRVGGATKVTCIRSQVERTLKQFPSVKRVVISVNGQTEGILEP